MMLHHHHHHHFAPYILRVWRPSSTKVTTFHGLLSFYRAACLVPQMIAHKTYEICNHNNNSGRSQKWLELHKNDYKLQRDRLKYRNCNELESIYTHKQVLGFIMVSLCLCFQNKTNVSYDNPINEHIISILFIVKVIKRFNGGMYISKGSCQYCKGFSNVFHRANTTKRNAFIYLNS